MTFFRIPAVHIYPLILICLCVGLASLKLHGSSVGMYHELLFGQSMRDQNLIWGQPRPIRSDEWLIITPFTVSQVHNNLQHRNPDIGSGQEMSILYDSPTNHWSTFFKPTNWSFFVVDLDFAFAFKWWFRGAIVAISSYYFFLRLTKKPAVAVAGSLILVFSPFVQWWYSTNALETLAFGFALLGCLMSLIRATRKLHILLLVCSISYFSIAYLFIMYPPFQISFGLLLLVIFSTDIWMHRAKINARQAKFVVAGLLFAGMVTVGSAIKYFLDFQDIITLIMHTEYPGIRQIAGGNMSLIHFFNGFYAGQLLNDAHTVPIVMNNQSEAAGYFLLSPFLIPLLIWQWMKGKKRFLLEHLVIFGIMTYLILGILWLLVGLPTPLAHVLLLTKVPETRMMLGIGVADLMLVLIYLTRVTRKTEKLTRRIAILTAFVVFELYIGIGLYLHHYYPVYLPHIRTVIVVASSTGLLIYLVIRQQTRYALLLLVTIAFISTAGVNPLYKGLGQLRNSSLMQTLQTLLGSDDTAMLTYNDSLWRQFLVGHGKTIVNATQFYPHTAIWQTFDPNKQQYAAYNRYSHYTFVTNPQNTVDFRVAFADSVIVSVSPCHSSLDSLNVTYILAVATELTEDCVTLIAEIPYPMQTFRLYRKIMSVY